MPTMRGHLVGAHGLFWKRDLVDWEPGPGKTWQLLGRRGKNRPGLRICDFRSAAGVYLLYDDYGPRYTGIARGSGGLGRRLKSHNRNEPHKIKWTRFSWFTFDTVKDVPRQPGWSQIDWRTADIPTNVDHLSREIEALLIKVLGFVQSQNQMKFLEGFEWFQLTPWDAHRFHDSGQVDPSGFSRPYWEDWA